MHSNTMMVIRHLACILIFHMLIKLMAVAASMVTTIMIVFLVLCFY